MDHLATVRRMYELINAGEVDAFGDLLADGFVEHGRVGEHWGVIDLLTMMQQLGFMPAGAPA